MKPPCNASPFPIAVIANSRTPKCRKLPVPSRATGTLPDQLVNTDPVRSAEPPISSGSVFA